MSRALLAILLWSRAGSAGEIWLRLSTPHFEVLTGSPAGQGQQVLRQFERIRQVLNRP